MLQQRESDASTLIIRALSSSRDGYHSEVFRGYVAEVANALVIQIRPRQDRTNKLPIPGIINLTPTPDSNQRSFCILSHLRSLFRENTISQEPL